MNAPTTDPLLFQYTTTAWQEFGELTKESAIQGLLAVRKALQPYIMDAIKKHNSPIIAEATFLEPNALKDCGKCVSVICPDQEQHLNQFFVHREKKPESDVQFQAPCYIDEFLLSEAKNIGVMVYNNSAQLLENPEEFLSKLGIEYGTNK